jgi:hypothetical protein
MADSSPWASWRAHGSEDARRHSSKSPSHQLPLSCGHTGRRIPAAWSSFGTSHEEVEQAGLADLVCLFAPANSPSNHLVQCRSIVVFRKDAFEWICRLDRAHRLVDQLVGCLAFACSRSRPDCSKQVLNAQLLPDASLLFIASSCASISLFCSSPLAKRSGSQW